MRFVVYALLGFVGGSVAGAVIGFCSEELLVWLKLSSRICFEGKCHWDSLRSGLYGFLAGAILGPSLGLWRAWLFRKRATAAALQP